MLIAVVVVCIFFIIKFKFDYKKEKIDNDELSDKLIVLVLIILVAISLLIISALGLRDWKTTEIKVNEGRKDNKRIEVLVCDRIKSYDDLEGVDVENILEKAKEDPKMMELANQYDYNNRMIKKYKKDLIQNPTKAKTKIDFYKESNKFLNEEIIKQLQEEKYNLVNVDTKKVVEKTVNDDVVKALFTKYFKNSRFIEKNQKDLENNILFFKVVI